MQSGGEKEAKNIATTNRTQVLPVKRTPQYISSKEKNKEVTSTRMVCDTHKIQVRVRIRTYAQMYAFQHKNRCDETRMVSDNSKPAKKTRERERETRNEHAIKKVN